MGLPSLHALRAKKPPVVRATGPHVIRAAEPHVIRATEPHIVRETEPTGAPHLARFSRDVGCHGTTPVSFRIYRQGTFRLASPTSHEKRARCPWLREIRGRVSSQTTRPYTIRVFLLLSAVTPMLLCAHLQLVAQDIDSIVTSASRTS